MRYYAAWLCRFVSVDPLQFEYPELTPYQYASNNPVTMIDLDGLEAADPQNKQTRLPVINRVSVPWSLEAIKQHENKLFILKNAVKVDTSDPNGRYIADETGKITKDHFGILFGVNSEVSTLYTKDFKASIIVNDKTVLSRLVGKKSVEITNAEDAFNLFKFLSDNSTSEWSLKGYRTDKGVAFLLSSSYKSDSVRSENGTYDPANLIFSLHSHPDGTDNIGPSGWITAAPKSSSAESNPGHSDLRTMMSNHEESPNSKHYIYHKGTKKLIYYDINTALNKKTQNERGRSIGIMSTGAQMRNAIIKK